MSLGEKIRVLRTRRKMQQKDLAKKLDVAQSSVADWESGKTHPRHARLAEIAKVLGTSVAKLIEAA